MVDEFVGESHEHRFRVQVDAESRPHAIDDLDHQRHHIIGAAVEVGLDEVGVLFRHHGRTDP